MEDELESVNVRVDLKGELLQKFLKIKKELGLENNTEIVRFLINKYGKIEAPL